MKECSECGNKVANDAYLCPKCGHKLGTSPGMWVVSIVIFLFGMWMAFGGGAGKIFNQ